MKIRTPYSPLALFAWQRDDAPGTAQFDPSRKWTALDAKRKFLGVLMVRSPKHQLSRLNIFML